MNDFLERAERAALRGIEHLLPQKWREMVELINAPIPPTPTGTVRAPADDAAGRLAPIEHIVVAMLENRSFDHMLGYLSLPQDKGGAGRTNVDGLKGDEAEIYAGTTYGIHHLDRTEFSSEAEDPDHSGRSVDEQLNTGFVANFASISEQRAHKLGVQVPDPGLVMGYYDASDLPVYDHLAREFCIVDRWFSSVPGATWPNRLYAATGQAAGTRDDLAPPIYALPSFVRYLDEHNVSWGWYSFDPGTLRAIDPAYRFSNHHRFSFFDSRKLSTGERAVGEVLEEHNSFLDDIEQDKLPAVSWIDPHFKDLRVLGPDSNDDHPPSDVIAGQDLVLTLFHALASHQKLWQKTLLIITYDEHGGFYDHVAPPAAVDEEHDFQRLGVRVPALLVSPLVAAGSTSTAVLGPEFHFDHTSIIKTIFTRFCQTDGQIPAMTSRVAAADHLGHLLTDSARAEVVPYDHLAQSMQQWRTNWAKARFADPMAVAADPRPLTDFQSGFYDMARRLRHAGLPAAHP
jgi:phospholipase C